MTYKAFNLKSKKQCYILTQQDEEGNKRVIWPAEIQGYELIETPFRKKPKTHVMLSDFNSNALCYKKEIIASQELTEKQAKNIIPLFEEGNPFALETILKD